MSRKTIERKRTQAMFRITRTAVGTSIGGAVPVPALELAKEIGIAAADAALMYDIYRIYNDEPLSGARLREMLGTAGVIVLTGGAISYISLRVGQGVLNELLNAFPLLGWVLRGLMTGATTVTVGLAWMTLVEDAYRKAQRIPAPAAAPAPQKTRTVKVPISTQAARSVSPFMETLEAEEPDATTASAPVDDIDTPEVPDEVSIMREKPEFMTTEHPQGKPGVTIPEVNYGLIRETIIESLRGQDSLPLQDVIDAAEIHADALDKSVRWYVTKVKLDLEARGIIERVDGISPQELRLIDKS